MIRSVLLLVCSLFISSLPVQAAEVDFCLAKHDVPGGSYPSTQHKQDMRALGVSCAKVFWKLASEANQKHPFAWIEKHYVRSNIPLTMVLLIDDGGSTVAASADARTAKVRDLLPRIIAERKDAELSALAAAVAKSGKPITIVPFHEAYASHMPWQVNDRLFPNLVDAYARVVDVFKRAGATNVTWGFNWNRTGPRGQPLRNMCGKVQALEAVGVTVHEISSYDRADAQSFADGFAQAYGEIAPCTANDVNVAETATAGVGVDRVAWHADLLSSLDQFPKVKKVTFFHGYGRKGRQLLTWKLESTQVSEVRTLITRFQRGVDLALLSR